MNRKKLAKSLMFAMLIAAVSAALSFAQDEEVPAPSSDPVSETAEAAEEEDAADAEEEETAEEVPAPPSFMTAEEPAEEVAQETPAPAPEASAKPEKIKKIKPPKEPRESSGDIIRMGGRASFGLSSFAGHKAVSPSADTALYFPWGVNGKKRKYVSLGSGISSSVGGSLLYNVSDEISVALELLYSQYTAHGSFEVKDMDDLDNVFNKLHEVFVEVHAIEVPIVGRYLLPSPVDMFYVEGGFVFGGNFYGKVGTTDGLMSPGLQKFGCGPTVGFGVTSGETLVGVRFYYNVVEYSENAGGNPWSFHFGLTSYVAGFGW